MINNKEYALVIKAKRSESRYWKDLWHYRELFWFLSWRDILARYKQTTIGITWSVLRPLLTMIVFTVIFGKLAKFSSEGVPYPIMVFSGMLPWQFFASSLSDCSNSLIANTNLLTKVYFPRLIVPASSVIVNLVELCITLIILVLLMVWYHFLPGWQIITLPLFLGLAFLTSFGFGLWFAALTVKYRDFRLVVPFIVQFGLFVSPVGFSSSVVPERWRLLYSLNPLVGLIDGFRWAVLGGKTQVNWTSIGMSTTVTILVLSSAVHYFRNTERTFADII